MSSIGSCHVTFCTWTAKFTAQTVTYATQTVTFAAQTVIYAAWTDIYATRTDMLTTQMDTHYTQMVAFCHISPYKLYIQMHHKFTLTIIFTPFYTINKHISNY